MPAAGAQEPCVYGGKRNPDLNGFSNPVLLHGFDQLRSKCAPLTKRFVASRLTEAGVSPVFVAQIMGHSNANILQTYAKAIDEYRRSAIAKLEALRQAQGVQLTERDAVDRAAPIQ